MNTVYFEKGSNFANVYNLYQWDYGQTLEIKGLDIHGNVWVQFSMHASGGNAVPVVTEVGDGVIKANIPAFVFEKETVQNYNAYAFVYISNVDSGETVKVIKLNIKARPKPDDYVYTEPEKKRYDLLEERIKEIEENGIPGGGNVVVDDALSETSTNPVQNKVVTKEMNRLSEEIVDQEALINNKTGKYVTPEQFGAKCNNGWSDDSKAVQDCLNYASSNQIPVRGLGAYHIYSPITITGKYQDVYLKQLTLHGTDHAVTIKTAYSSVSIDLLYAPNGSGVNCLPDTSNACLFNKFNFPNILTSGNCISIGNLDGETNSIVGYNSFSLHQMKSSNGNCVRGINLSGGENSFNGNSSGIEATNDYAFYLKKCGTINVDKFAIESCKSGFYVEDTKVVAGYIRTRECMDTKRIDSGDKGLMLKLVGMAQFYSDFTHIDLTCIDTSELDHLFESSGLGITDEESISYVKAGRYCNANYYNESRDSYDIPGYIRMTGHYVYLDYEGRQIYHDFTENLDLRNWGILPPNVLDIHADGDFILNNAYCSNGISVININQTYGHFITVKDKNENVIFDGSEHGFGTYQLQCFISKASDDRHEWLYNPEFDTWKVVQTSKKEDVFELIETITVEEDGTTSIVRTEEPDGAPYKFKNIFVHGTVPTKTEESKTLSIYCGDGVNNWASGIWINNFLNKNYDNVQAWGTFLKSNGWLIPISSNGQNYSPATLVSNMTKPVSAHIIKRISIGTGGLSFPIGTTIEIYAIRA